MTLRELGIGESALILSVGGEGALRQHFLDMGVIPGAEVTVIKFAPMGDPVEIKIHGYELTLRLDDAAKIEIQKITKAQAEEIEENERKASTEHPGLGEGGKFHPKGTGDPLPQGTVLSFALVGNQNSGLQSAYRIQPACR